MTNMGGLGELAWLIRLKAHRPGQTALSSHLRRGARADSAGLTLLGLRGSHCLLDQCGDLLLQAGVADQVAVP